MIDHTLINENKPPPLDLSLDASDFPPLKPSSLKKPPISKKSISFSTPHPSKNSGKLTSPPSTSLNTSSPQSGSPSVAPLSKAKVPSSHPLGSPPVTATVSSSSSPSSSQALPIQVELPSSDPSPPMSMKSLEPPPEVIFRNIPPQLYSFPGISIIASAIGEPMHTEKSRLSPIQVGEAKIKVEIRLSKPLPPTVVVRDSKGNSVKITAEYPRPPPKCSVCNEFGHTITHCNKAASQKKKPKKNLKTSQEAQTIAAKTTNPILVEPPSVNTTTTTVVPSVVTLPPPQVQVSPPQITIAVRTIHSPAHSRESSPTSSTVGSGTLASITSSQVADLEEALMASKFAPKSSASKLPSNYKELSPKAKKRARKKQRQAFMEAHKLAGLMQARNSEVTSSLSSRQVLPEVGESS